MEVERQRLQHRKVDQSAQRQLRVFRTILAAATTIVTGCVVFDASQSQPASPTERPNTPGKLLDPKNLPQVLYRCHVQVSPGAMYLVPDLDRSHLVREWGSDTRLDMFTPIIDRGGKFLATTVFGRPTGEVVFVPIASVKVWDGCGNSAYVQYLGQDLSGVPLGRMYRDPDKKVLINDETGYARANFQENTRK